MAQLRKILHTATDASTQLLVLKALLVASTRDSSREPSIGSTLKECIAWTKQVRGSLVVGRDQQNRFRGLHIVPLVMLICHPLQVDPPNRAVFTEAIVDCALWIGNSKLMTVARDPNSQGVLEDLMDTGQQLIADLPLKPIGCRFISLVTALGISWYTMADYQRAGMDPALPGAVTGYILRFLHMFDRLPYAARDCLALAVGRAITAEPSNTVESWIDSGLGSVIARLLVCRGECLDSLASCGMLWPSMLSELLREPRRFACPPLSVVASVLRFLKGDPDSRTRFLDQLLCPAYFHPLWKALGGSNTRESISDVELEGVLVLFEGANEREVPLKELDPSYKANLGKCVLRDLWFFASRGTVWDYILASLWGGGLGLCKHVTSVIQDRLARGSGGGHAKNITEEQAENLLISIGSLSGEQVQAAKEQGNSVVTVAGRDLCSRIVKVMSGCQKTERRSKIWTDKGKAVMIGVAFGRMTRMFDGFEGLFHATVGKGAEKVLEFFRADGIIQ